MPRPPYPRNVVEFNRMFPDEDACLAYLTECRWPGGFRCPHCGHDAAFLLPRRRLWQCKSCGHQTSATAGTVMHRTRTPLLTWFWAAFWMTAQKPGLSALQLQHMLGLARYETTWLILHKLRRAMVNANREPLKGTVEIDETFIGGEQLRLQGARQLSGRKALLVVVAVEVRRNESGRCRAEVIPDATAGTLSSFIVRNIQQGSAVLSDGHRLAGTEDPVPHAHRAISNLKAWLLGTHRGVGAHQLPVYLDEFVFRWNRRRAPMAGFQTLLGLGTHREPATCDEILGARPTSATPRPRGRKTGLTTMAAATGGPRPAG